MEQRVRRAGKVKEIELVSELTVAETDRPTILRNATCPYCGVLIAEDADSEEHVIARRLVPKGTLAGTWNLRLQACKPCNGEKSALEDDLSAITMQPDVLGRHAHDHPALRSESERKGRSVSKRTGKPVAGSIERLSINGSPWPGVNFTFNLSGSPQADAERVFELCRLQLMAFFYWLTYNPTERRGGLSPGYFTRCCRLCELTGVIRSTVVSWMLLSDGSPGLYARRPQASLRSRFDGIRRRLVGPGLWNGTTIYESLGSSVI